MKKKRIVKLEPQTVELFAEVLSKLRPPPPLTVSQWADRYRVLSAESSAEPGRWHTEKAPYQRAIMDAIGDPHVRSVVVMSAAQIGKTDAFILNPLGYYMDYTVFLLLSAHPPALCRAGVDMYPAVSTVGVSFLRVAANASAVRQQGLGICRDLLHRHTRNPNVSSLAVKMLRELRSILDCGIFAGGSETAGDVHRLPEVVADFLKDFHQLRINKDRVGIIRTAELPHLERRGEILLAILRPRVWRTF